jgi:hypothetical protein
MPRASALTLPALVAALVVGLALPTPAPAAPKASFKAKRVKGDRAVFTVKRCCRTKVESAVVRTGPFRRRLNVRWVRRGVHRGVVDVRLPRKGRRVKVRRRSRTRLTLILARHRPTTPPAAAPRPVSGWVGGMESGGFSEFDSFSAWEGDLVVTGDRAYEGQHAARAAFAGAGESGAQRAWKQVAWGSGSDVWYGMALNIADVDAFCYWNPIRWDNYKTYGSGGDVGGLAIEDGQLSVIQNRYGQSERQLISGVAIPEGRWVWVEVHQRFAATDGHALTELYLDGKRVGLSTSANSAGRQIDHLRFGVVNVAGSCSDPGSVEFDRASITDGMLGPAA